MNTRISSAKRAPMRRAQLCRAVLAAVFTAVLSAALAAAGTPDAAAAPGVIRDSSTRLEWTREDNGADIDWKNAEARCAGMKDGWRLPAVQELEAVYLAAVGRSESVVCGPNICFAPPLFKLSGSWFWSSTPAGVEKDDSRGLFWGVLMVNGARTKALGEFAYASRVLCVRPLAARSLPFVTLPSFGAQKLTIDASHSAVVFSWSHLGFTNPVARLEKIEGTLVLDTEDMSKSSVSVTMPLSGLRTANESLDNRLKTDEFLDATRYPDVTFRSTRVETPAKDELKISGDLSIHGITRPITFNARINRIGVNPISKLTTVGFDADVVLRRSDFAVSKYVPAMTDELFVHITLGADLQEDH